MSQISRAGQKFVKREVPKFLRESEKKRRQKFAVPFARYDESVPEDERFDDFEEWKFFPGDRVLITKGPKKGTITKVAGFYRAENKLILEDGPTEKKIFPKQLWHANTVSYVSEAPIGVAVDDLKLVVKTTDEQTGQDKDVIVHKLDFLGKHFNKDYQEYLPTRVVKTNGEILYLPWPVPENKLTRTAAANEDVNSERTFFVDSVVHNQIPREALSTIRNPHSKYRRGVFEQRHLNKFTGPQMPLSATKKAYLKELEAKKRLGANKLTPELKDFVGSKVKEFIEKRKNELSV